MNLLFCERFLLLFPSPYSRIKFLNLKVKFLFNCIDADRTSTNSWLDGVIEIESTFKFIFYLSQNFWFKFKRYTQKWRNIWLSKCNGTKCWYVNNIKRPESICVLNYWFHLKIILKKQNKTQSLKILAYKQLIRQLVCIFFPTFFGILISIYFV